MDHEMRRQLAAWDDWIVARDRAHTTGDFTDGVAAGLAWRAFLDVFLPTGGDHKVIPFMRGTDGPDQKH